MHHVPSCRARGRGSWVNRGLGFFGGEGGFGGAFGFCQALGGEDGLADFFGDVFVVEEELFGVFAALVR